MVVISVLALLLSPLCAEPLNLLLDWYPNPDHVPLFVGREKGFYKEEGIDINLIKVLDRPRGLATLESERVEIVLYCTMPLLRAAARHDDLSIVGRYIGVSLMGIGVREESGITSPRELAGKAIAANPDGTVAAVLNNFAKVEKIEYGAIKKVFMSLPIALAMKRIDAISGIFWNVESHQLAANGIKNRVFRFTEMGVPDHPELLFVARKSWQKNHRELIERFNRATKKSIAYAKKHPDEAFNIYAALMVDKSAKTLKWERASWEMTAPLFADDPRLDPAPIANLYNWMEEHDLLKKSYNVKSLLE